MTRYIRRSLTRTLRGIISVGNKKMMHHPRQNPPTCVRISHRMTKRDKTNRLAIITAPEARVNDSKNWCSTLWATGMTMSFA